MYLPQITTLTNISRFADFVKFYILNYIDLRIKVYDSYDYQTWRNVSSQNGLNGPTLPFLLALTCWPRGYKNYHAHLSYCNQSSSQEQEATHMAENFV